MRINKNLLAAIFGILLLGAAVAVGLFVRAHGKATYVAPPFKDPNAKLSVFEQIIARNSGQIPIEFRKLMEIVVSKSNEMEDDARDLIIVLNPYSRSGQKKNVSLENPRLLGAYGDRWPVFLGYAPLANQVEVISFNPTYARYDFLEIKDYRTGGQPRIEMSNRENCMTCHQHGGPIFPRSPWREMRERLPGAEPIFNDANKGTTNIFSHNRDVNLIGKKILKARNGKTDYHGFNLNEYWDESGPFFGPMIRGPAASLGFYIMNCNYVLQMHKIFVSLCGEDKNCRMLLLKTALIARALIQGVVSPMTVEKTRPIFDKIISQLQNEGAKRWPADRFEYISPFLPDRQIQNNGKEEGFLIRPFADGVDLTFDSHVGDYRPEEFWYLYGQTPQRFGKVRLSEFHEERTFDANILDPKTPRPKTGAQPPNPNIANPIGEVLLQNAAGALNFSLRDMKMLQRFNLQQLIDILDNPKYEKFTQQWPPDTNAVLRTLLHDLALLNLKEFDNLQADIEYYLGLGSKATLAEAQKSIGLNVQSSKANLLGKYCAACHLNEEGWELSKFENPKVLGKLQGVCDAIRDHSMPPRRFGLKPNPTEVSEMLSQLGCIQSN